MKKLLSLTLLLMVSMIVSAQETPATPETQESQESQESQETQAVVVNISDFTGGTVSVKPGDTVEVRADFSGMYVVHTLDGQYMKKVAVRK